MQRKIQFHGQFCHNEFWPFKNKWKKLPSYADRQKKNVSSYGCAGLLLQIRLDLKASFSLHAFMENYVCITCFNGFVIVIHEKCKCKYHQITRHFIPFLVSFHSQVRMCWPCAYVHVFIPVLMCFLYFGSVFSKIDKQLKSWMRTLYLVTGCCLGAIINMKVKHGDKEKATLAPVSQKQNKLELTAQIHQLSENTQTGCSSKKN